MACTGRPYSLLTLSLHWRYHPAVAWNTRWFARRFSAGGPQTPSWCRRRTHAVVDAALCVPPCRRFTNRDRWRRVWPVLRWPGQWAGGCISGCLWQSSSWWRLAAGLHFRPGGPSSASNLMRPGRGCCKRASSPARALAETWCSPTAPGRSWCGIYTTRPSTAR